MTSTHEVRAHDHKEKGGSDRSFGFVFMVVFLLIGVWPLTGNWEAFGRIRWWSITVAAAIFLISMLVPRILAPVSKFWMGFGLLLHRIISPVMLCAMFFVALTPVALIVRWRGKNLLNLEAKPGDETYWIECSDKIQTSMTNQF